MKSLDHQAFLNVLRAAQAPCISLYQPTHRRHPDNQQDPIRYRNQVDAVEASLGESHGVRTVRSLIGPFRKLERDRTFWNHTLDGLAVLACEGTFETFLLQRAVPERVVVADSFHAKPLVRILQSADRYQVLCLGGGNVRLLEGNRDVLDEVDLDPGVPRGTDDGRDAAERGRAAQPSPEVDQDQAKGLKRSTSTSRRHRGTPQDAIDLDVEKHFRAVDRAIAEAHSKPTGLPMVLATLPEHQPVFRGLSRNPALLPLGIDGDPFARGLDDLRRAAWEVVAPYYTTRLAGLVDAYNEAHAKHRGSPDAATVADAAVASRVKTLLIEADRVIPGRLNHATGRITFDDLGDPEVDDLHDDLAELVLERGGEVIVVPRDAMPTDSGLAAIFRH